mgnify:CR=1 FL=1
MREQAERDRIWDALHTGVVTPHEAEEMAADAGLPPLRSVPGDHEFGPMPEAWWTLPMVVAWIVWRSAKAVRLHFDQYRLAAPYWYYQTIRCPSFQGGGWFLTQQDPATLSDLALREVFQIAQAAREPMQMSVHEAQRDLSTKAANGDLVASAQRLADNAVVEIRANEWPYLLFHFGRDSPNELRYEHDGATALYGRIRFRTAEVLRLWPVVSRKVASRKEAEAGFREWLSTHVHASLTKPTLTKQQAIEHAKEHFGLAAKSGTVLWSEVVASAPAWSRPGPRSGNRIRNRIRR